MKKLFFFFLPIFLCWSFMFGQTVTTLAGSGIDGYINDTGSLASFSFPFGVAVDGSGTVYLADTSNLRIRKITATGVVTTLAGSGTVGFANGTGTATNFNDPYGVAVDGSGNVYVADTGNHRIRKITATGVVTTFAGSGTAAFADGTGSAARFNSPRGVAIDASGTLYVSDYSNHRIRKITSSGVVTTLAGSGTAAFADGTGTTASFAFPQGIAVDISGNVYVADTGNHRIRKITTTGVVTTLAGNGSTAFSNGIGTAASFNTPMGVAVDAFGNIYVSDYGNNRIRKITSDNVVTTIAGSALASFSDGTATSARFNYPSGICIDILGDLYVADTRNHRIRKITNLLETTDFEINEQIFSIYPNPTTHELYVKSSTNEDVNYSITNTIGQILQQGFIHTNQAIDVANLTVGLYFISLNKESYKFIKR